MIPVFLHGTRGNRGLSFQDFERQVLQICDEHHAQGRACAFAFLLHSANSPDLGKVLNDPGYWAALDSISGRSLSVFSVFNGALRRTEDFEPEEHASYMLDVERGSGRVLEMYFGGVARRFPSVLFFQVDSGAVIASRLVVLRMRGVEATYQEVADLLTLAGESVRHSIGKQIRDREDAFARIDRALTSRALFAAGNSAFAVAKAVGPWIRSFFSWM